MTTAASHIGANFCHVIITKPILQVTPAITLGNHWWVGALPTFTISPINIALPAKDGKMLKFAMIGAAKNIVDPVIWAIKYLAAASADWPPFVITIIGINERRLISKPTQARIQFADDKLRHALMARVIEKRRNAGNAENIQFKWTHGSLPAISPWKGDVLIYTTHAPYWLSGKPPLSKCKLVVLF